MTSVLIWPAAIAEVAVLYSARYWGLRKIGRFLEVADDDIVVLSSDR